MNDEAKTLIAGFFIGAFFSAIFGLFFADNSVRQAIRDDCAVRGMSRIRENVWIRCIVTTEWKPESLPVQPVGAAKP